MPSHGGAPRTPTACSMKAQGCAPRASREALPWVPAPTDTALQGRQQQPRGGVPPRRLPGDFASPFAPYSEHPSTPTAYPRTLEPPHAKGVPSHDGTLRNSPHANGVQHGSPGLRVPRLAGSAALGSRPPADTALQGRQQHPPQEVSPFSKSKTAAPWPCRALTTGQLPLSVPIRSS
jgi:hypothetical protein